jgi:transcription elongation regulator 1
VGSSHEREELFGEYLGSISDAVRKRQRMASAEERLKEREREVRRRREKEEREMDEQRSKVRLEEAVAHFEALLSERVKHHDVRPIFNLNFYIYLNISI